MIRSCLLIAALVLFSGHIKAEGINLTFSVNEDYLICHILHKDKTKIPAVSKFLMDLKKEFPREVEYLHAVELLTPESISKSPLSLAALISKAKLHPQYVEIKKETDDHLIEVRNEWMSNLASTSTYMKSVTRLDFNKTINVLITHPQVYQGTFLGNNFIGWGRKPEWKNYSTVYLWHEILHSYLQFNQKSHALIELATDDDLRFFLNAKGYPPFSPDGHPKLKPIKKWIFEKYWKAYLGDNSMNLIQLEQKLQEDKVK